MAKAKQAEEKSTEVQTRIVAPLQSLGRVGKSTLSQALITFGNFAGIPLAALDADAEHKTLVGWYGDEVGFLPFKHRDDFLPILDAVGNAPLEIIDFPAQATDAILEGITDFSAGRVLKEKKARLTIPIFASDERIAMLSAHKIITTLGEDADYVLIYNPARYKSEQFDKSAIPGLIPNAKKIVIPAITKHTIDAVDAASKKLRQSLTFDQALEHVSLAQRMELETWLNKLFAQFEDAAEVLLPPGTELSNRVTRVQERAKAEVSAFDL